MTTEAVAVLAGIGAVSFALSYVGAAVGLVLGPLRLPLLVYALGSPVAGASTNLAISGAGAAAGAWKHARDGRVSGRLVLLMGVPSVVGAVAGVLILVSVSVVWSHLLIGGMLVYSGFELFRRRAEADDAAPAGGLPGRWVAVGEVLIGLGLGALAAVTGLMLGTMRLPVMIRWLRVEPGVAVGSNLVIGCVTAVVAAATAWAAGGPLDPLALLVVGPPTVLGGYLGARRTGRLSPAKVKAWAGVVIALSGLAMVGVAARTALRGQPPAEERVPHDT